MQSYRPSCSWNTIYPDEYDTDKRSQLFKEQLHLLPPGIIYDSRIYENIWADGFEVFDVIISAMKLWSRNSYIDSNEVGLWINNTIEKHLNKHGILVCLLPTNYLLQQDNHPSSSLELLISRKYIRMVVDLPRVTKDDYEIGFANFSLIFLSKEENEEIFMVDGKKLYCKAEHSFFDYCLDWKKLVKVIGDRDENYVSVINNKTLQDFSSLSPSFYISYFRFLSLNQNELQYCKQLSKIANVNCFNKKGRPSQIVSNVITPNHLANENTCEILNSDGEKGFPYAKVKDPSYLFSFQRQTILSGYYKGEERTHLYIDKNICSIIFCSEFLLRDKDNRIIEEKVEDIVEDFLIETQGWFLNQEILDYQKDNNPYITIDSYIFFSGFIEYRKEIVINILNSLFDAKPDDNDVDEYLRLLEHGIDSPSALEELHKFVDSSNKEHRYFNSIRRAFYNSKGIKLESVLFSYLIHNNPKMFSQIMKNDFIYKQLFIMGSEWKLLLDKLFIPICHFEKFGSPTINGVSRIKIQRNTDKIKLNSSKGFYSIIIESIDKDPVVLDLGWAGKIVFIAALIKNMQAINLSKYNKDKNRDLVLLEEVNSLLYPKEKATDISVLFDPVSRTKRISDANKKIEEILGENNPCCIQIHTDISNSFFQENTAVTKRTTYASIKFPRYKCIFPLEFNNLLDENNYEFDQTLINCDLNDLDISKETLPSRDKTQLMF